MLLYCKFKRFKDLNMQKSLQYKTVEFRLWVSAMHSDVIVLIIFPGNVNTNNRTEKKLQ